MDTFARHHHSATTRPEGRVGECSASLKSSTIETCRGRFPRQSELSLEFWLKNTVSSFFRDLERCISISLYSGDSTVPRYSGTMAAFSVPGGLSHQLDQLPSLTFQNIITGAVVFVSSQRLHFLLQKLTKVRSHYSISCSKLFTIST